MATFTQRVITSLSLISIIFSLIGCSNDEIEKQEKSTMETFDLITFFSGQTHGSGFLQDRSGKIIRTFEVLTVGTFDDESGTLEETFTWNDGEIENRTWTLNRTSDTGWSGRAPDVVGVASGVVIGDVLRWSYTLTIKVGGKKMNFK
ncbi:MAG TPA: hypothetical protein DEO41_01110, partial [Betaproteobacteria bacterium]|nr:hypothetical protein [Betaproteobacteria bacterium]